MKKVSSANQIKLFDIIIIHHQTNLCLLYLPLFPNSICLINFSAKNVLAIKKKEDV